MQPTSGFEWSYRDLLWTLTLAFMAIAALALSAVPPKAAGHVEAAKMIITLRWDAGQDDDVDLWAELGDGQPIGYRHRDTKNASLRHDHRGFTNEQNWDNNEVIDVRHLVPGRVTINAVMFDNIDHKFPVHTHLIVEKINQDTGAATTLYRVDRDLTAKEQELTLIGFRIDDNGEIIPGSENDLHACLWRAC